MRRLISLVMVFALENLKKTLKSVRVEQVARLDVHVTITGVDFVAERFRLISLINPKAVVRNQ